MSIDTMKQALEALRNDAPMCAFDILEQAIAEAEKQEPEKYALDIECERCGAKQSGVLTVHTHPQPKREEEAAIKTLNRLGYTYYGSELWKPPLGKAPSWVEQAPVAWMYRISPAGWELTFNVDDTIGAHKVFPLTHPQSKREWVGLTDEEIEAKFKQCGGKWNGDQWVIEDADLHPFVRSIESPDIKTLKAISDEYNAWIRHHAAGHSYDDFLQAKLKEKNT